MTEEKARQAKEKYKLTDNQLTFCELYLENGNAQKSYMIAFKNDNANTASVNSTKLMKKDKIASYIAEGKKKNSFDPRIASAEEVLRYYTRLFYDESEKRVDRNKAADMLGKYHGLFNDKIDISHDVEINLGFDLPELIENKIIDQKNKAIEENEEYYEAEFEEVEDED